MFQYCKKFLHYVKETFRMKKFIFRSPTGLPIDAFIALVIDSSTRGINFGKYNVLLQTLHTFQTTLLEGCSEHDNVRCGVL